MYISEISDKKPEDTRDSAEMACYELLEQLQIPYQRIDHDVTATMEDCVGVGQKLGVSICKNLFLTNRQKTKFYLLIMPDDKVFHTKDLSKQIGSARLSFAGAEEMQQLLNTSPGSASILGLQFDTENQVQLLIDRDVLQQEYFGCHPCKNTSSLRIKTADVLQRLLPGLHHTFMEVTL